MDDDSGAGALVGLALLLGALYLVLLVIGAILATIAIGALALMTTLAFLAVGAGINLGVRHGISLLGAITKNETSSTAARRGLAAVYAAPLVLLGVTLPLLASPLGVLAWAGGLFLSLPAYYWTWWNGHLARSQIQLSDSRNWTVEIPEIHLEVSRPMDATMQAEEKILFAQFQARRALAGFQTKVWMLEAKARVREQWELLKEGNHGTLGR